MQTEKRIAESLDPPGDSYQSPLDKKGDGCGNCNKAVTSAPLANIMPVDSRQASDDPAQYLVDAARLIGFQPGAINQGRIEHGPVESKR